MKRVTIDIDDLYSDMLSLTTIGSYNSKLMATTVLIDLDKHNHIIIDDKGIVKSK